MSIPRLSQHLTFEDVSIFFASELRAIVVSVDYGLSPEHQFPVAHDDCYQTIEWCIANAGLYGIDTARIGMWGCSAGGNLAAGIALRDADEHKKPRLCHVQLMVPATCHPDLYPPELNTERSSTNFSGKLGRDTIKTLLGTFS